MRKFGKVVIAFILFLTLFSMGVQQVASLATMGSGPVGQRGLEVLPPWARWAVGALGLVVAVGGARKMLQSGSASPSTRQPPRQGAQDESRSG
jgi:hypothetical protein